MPGLLLPIRDQDDLRMRVRNYRASANCCPTCWRDYFDTLAQTMESQMQ